MTFNDNQDPMMYGQQDNNPGFPEEFDSARDLPRENQYQQLQDSYYIPQDNPLQNDVQWELTESDLESLIEQTKNTKSQLRHDLLFDRSFCNHVLKNADNTHEDQRREAEKRIETINASLRRWFGSDKMANELFIDGGRSYYTFIDKLPVTPTKDNTQIWSQLTELLSLNGVMPNFITAQYDNELEEKWQSYQAQGYFLQDSFLENVYDDLQERDIYENVAGVNVPFEDTYYVETVSPELDQVFDDNNKIVMEISRNENQQISVIKHFRNEKVVSIDYFDNREVLSYTQFFDKKDEKKLVRENYYREDGTLVLIKSFDEDGLNIQLFTSSNVLLEEFSSEEALVSWWLANKVFKGIPVSIFVPVSSVYYNELLKLRNYGFEIIPVVMSVNKFTEKVERIINDADKITAIVAGSDKVNEYINQKSKQRIDITTIREYEESDIEN
ncbi:hypothetical protein [Lactobacillus terrae]|uniref:hypothetical protein n=1 Tax=Lactobacillus terrae TaxID=2269374 RepID=UPI000C1B7B48|nr:hypothetical protein [Lactobacillus terrae]